MQRLALIGMALVGFALVGCGDQTNTGTLVISGGSVGSVSLVVTGSAAAIKDLDHQVQNTGPLPNITFGALDGDKHTGAKACERDVVVDAYHEHVVIYGTNSSLAAAFCSYLDGLGT